MKRIFQNMFGPQARERMREYWRSMMRSKKHVNMSEGSQEINKVMTSAHKDQWRGQNKKHHKS